MNCAGNLEDHHGNYTATHLTDHLYAGCISLLLPRWPKLPGPFEQYWLGSSGSSGSVGSNKEIQLEVQKDEQSYMEGVI